MHIQNYAPYYQGVVSLATKPKAKATNPRRGKEKYFPTDMYYTSNARPQALQLMVEAVQGERNDELFYDYLLSEAPDADQKAIIMAIRDDERKHNRMFRQIYWEITGLDIQPGDEPFTPPSSYVEGLVEAMFGELAAVEKYRKILFGLGFLPYRNMLTEIYTDELKHATKWEYLYTLNTRE